MVDWGNYFVLFYGENAGLFKYPHLLSMLMFKHFDLLPRSQPVSPHIVGQTGVMWSN